MELDTKNKTLIYFRNGNKIGSWCKNIDFNEKTKYNMAVCMRHGEYTVQLTDFKTI